MLLSLVSAIQPAEPHRSSHGGFGQLLCTYLAIYIGHRANVPAGLSQSPRDSIAPETAVEEETRLLWVGGAGPRHE